MTSGRRAVAARTTRARAAALSAWATGVAVFVWRRGVPFDREQVIAICLVGLAAASVGARSAWQRLLHDWLPIAAVLAAYDYTRGAADLVGRPVLVRWPADADRASRHSPGPVGAT